MGFSPKYSKNRKLGPGITTYSRTSGATCPGKTKWCESVCYAARMENRRPSVKAAWERNNQGDVPELPSHAVEGGIVRWHVGGDFDSAGYIDEWIHRATENPTVQFFGFTRSWRVRKLLPRLQVLRDLPNVQLFASVDPSHRDRPDTGWRVAFADMEPEPEYGPTMRCKEQTEGATCADCKFCIVGQRGNVLFGKH